MASRDGHAKVVELLIKAGAVVNVMDKVNSIANFVKKRVEHTLLVNSQNPISGET